MGSIPLNNINVSTSTVWRDALGPGYAVGVVEGLLKVAVDAAARPYKARR